MAKTYFNSAIVGNSCMLGCLTSRGELTRLFWPNIDYPQHIDKFYTGISISGAGGRTAWLHEDSWHCCQRYIEDTNILETSYDLKDGGIRAVQTDFILPDTGVLVREYDIENTGGTEIELKFMAFSSGLTSNQALLGTLFDFGCKALIHYRHNYYIAIGSDREADEFQLGNNALEGAGNGSLTGSDSTGMISDAAAGWRLGALPPGEKSSIALYICASHSLKGAKELVRLVKSRSPEELKRRTKAYWLDFLNNAKKLTTGRQDIDTLYKRSLLVFKLMSDEKTGGLLAAPEIDEEFTRCGRYAYCWGRDAAFITEALDKCGLSETVDRFYDWAARTQEEDGSWHQRYHMDGNLGPSWGLQIDETGTLIRGVLEHYRFTQDYSFLLKMWDTVKKAVDFLTGFIDPETGLPAPSFDLWEERWGEHAYSSAAVYSGMASGAEIAEILGMEAGIAEAWRKAAGKVKEAIAAKLWKSEWNRFIRSIRVKLNPWGGEPSGATTVVSANPLGYKKEVTLEDGIIDVSLLGVSVPFGVFSAFDPMVSGTAEAVENNLSVSPAGGIKRYEYDSYIGGNPWVLATLWVALYHIDRKEYGRARNYFEWAVRARTELGLLPEQVDREKGGPAWVIPLTWSHAMFILVLFRLAEAGELG